MSRLGLLRRHALSPPLLPPVPRYELWQEPYCLRFDQNSGEFLIVPPGDKTIHRGRNKYWMCQTISQLTQNQAKTEKSPCARQSDLPHPGEYQTCFSGRSSDLPSSSFGPFPYGLIRTVVSCQNRQAYSSGGCAGMSAMLMDRFTGFPFHLLRGCRSRHLKTYTILYCSGVCGKLGVKGITTADATRREASRDIMASRLG